MIMTMLMIVVILMKIIMTMVTMIRIESVEVCLLPQLAASLSRDAIGIRLAAAVHPASICSRVFVFKVLRV